MQATELFNLKKEPSQKGQKYWGHIERREGDLQKPWEMNKKLKVSRPSCTWCESQQNDIKRYKSEIAKNTKTINKDFLNLYTIPDSSSSKEKEKCSRTKPQTQKHPSIH